MKTFFVGMLVLCLSARFQPAFAAEPTALTKQEAILKAMRQSQYAPGALPEKSRASIRSLLKTLACSRILSETILGGPVNRSAHPELSLLSPSDFLPASRGGVKVIHEYGVAGAVRFVANPDSGFSGIFHTGSEAGIIRLSTAVKPNDARLIPGMALKFLLDGENRSVDSAVAMYRLSGQDIGTDGDNFFAHAFATKIPAASGDIALQIGSVLFEKALRRVPNGPTHANYLSVSQFAKTNADGSAVAAPISPDYLEFVPTEAVQTAYAQASETVVDFRDRLARAIPAGTVIWQVFGVRDGKRIEVGRIQTTSEMIASEFSDRVLNFQHSREPTAQ